MYWAFLLVPHNLFSQCQNSSNGNLNIMNLIHYIKISINVYELSGDGKGIKSK